jgi:hypothetical protein
MDPILESVPPRLAKLTSQIPSVEFLLFFFVALIADLALLGLSGDSNSRWLSFLDSLSHCSAWAVEDADLSRQTQVIGTILSKYGSGSIVSALLGVTPGFLQTSTTIIFALALAIAQSESRVAQLVRSRRGPWRILFVLVGSLHKSRKLRFALSKCHSPVSALIIGTLAIELTGWLVILVRNAARGNPIGPACAKLIYRNRLRSLFAVMAILTCYWSVWPMVTVGLLALHKAATPSESGSTLSFEIGLSKTSLANVF